MAEIEKASGGKIPNYITEGWVREDRQIAEAFAAMEKEESLFPKINPSFANSKFGKLMVFGTGGELTEEQFNQVKNPFNIKQDE